MVHRIRAISLDLTGTIIGFTKPPYVVYADICCRSGMKKSPTSKQWKPAFIQSFNKHSIDSPCYGAIEGITEREWWYRMVMDSLIMCIHGRPKADEFNNFFNNLYQFYGTTEGYSVLSDAVEFLNLVRVYRNDILLGLTSNTSLRMMDNILPSLKLKQYFDIINCSEAAKVEKPDASMFQLTFDKFADKLPNLKKHEVLHVGDDKLNDFQGAIDFGFKSILIDRRTESKVMSLSKEDNSVYVRMQDVKTNNNSTRMCNSKIILSPWENKTVSNFHEITPLIYPMATKCNDKGDEFL